MDIAYSEHRYGAAGRTADLSRIPSIVAARLDGPLTPRVFRASLWWAERGAKRRGRRTKLSPDRRAPGPAARGTTPVIMLGLRRRARRWPDLRCDGRRPISGGAARSSPWRRTRRSEERRVGKECRSRW